MSAKDLAAVIPQSPKTRRLSQQRFTSLEAACQQPNKQAYQQIAKLQLRCQDIESSLESIWRSKPQHAERLTRGVARSWQRLDAERNAQAKAMVQWADTCGPKARRMVCRSLRLEGKGDLLIHQIGFCSQQTARRYMADFFAEGGTMTDVANWFASAGHILRQAGYRPGSTTDGWGWLGDAWDYLKSAGEAVVNGLSHAIATVANALIEGSKSIYEAVQIAVNWSVSRIVDFVTAVGDMAGSVLQLLEQVSEYFYSKLGKFISAVLETMGPIGDLLSWAAGKTMAIMELLIDKAIAYGHTVVDIVTESMPRMAYSVVRRTIQGIYDYGVGTVAVLQAIAQLDGAAFNEAIMGLSERFNSDLVFLLDVADYSTDLFVKSYIILTGGRAPGFRYSFLFNSLATAVTPAQFRAAINKTFSGSISSSTCFQKAEQAGQAAVERTAHALRLHPAVPLVDLCQALHTRQTQSITAAFRVFVNPNIGRKQVTLGRIVSAYVQLPASAVKSLLLGLWPVVLDIGGMIRAMSHHPDNLKPIAEGMLYAPHIKLVDMLRVIGTGRHVSPENRERWVAALMGLGCQPTTLLTVADSIGKSAATAIAIALFGVMGDVRPLTTAEKSDITKIFGGIGIRLSDLRILTAPVQQIDDELLDWFHDHVDAIRLRALVFNSPAQVTRRAIVEEACYIWLAKHAGSRQALDVVQGLSMAQLSTTVGIAVERSMARYLNYPNAIDILAAPLRGRSLRPYVPAHRRRVTNKMLAARDGDISRFNSYQKAVIAREWWWHTIGKNLRGGAGGPASKLSKSLLRPYGESFKQHGIIAKLPVVQAEPILVREAKHVANNAAGLLARGLAKGRLIDLTPRIRVIPQP